MSQQQMHHDHASEGQSRKPHGLPDSKLRLPLGVDGAQYGRDESRPGIISF